MVLKKQDSGVCLTTETTHSDVAEVSPAVAFYVDTGGQPSSAGDASATRRQTPTRSSAGLPPTSPRHADRLEETRSGQLSPRSASSPRTAFGMPGRPQEEPRSAGTRKTVGQKLQGALPKALTKSSKRDSAPLDLTPQDEKILKIMRERKEAEERERVQRELRQREWESRHRVQRSSSSHHQPAAAAAGPACARPQLTASLLSRNEASLEATSPSTTTLDTLSRPSSRLDGTSDYASASRRTSICTSVTSVTDCHSPIERGQNKHELKAAERRRSVEQRLEQQRHEMAEHAEQVRLRQEEELQKASTMRLSREKQQAMRARLANEKVDQRREQVMKQKQQSLIDLTARREAIDAKLSAAEAKVQKMREEETQKARSDLQKRFEQSREKQRQTEEEMETWRQELASFSQWQGDNAEKIARQNHAQKGMKACQMRFEKEKKQQENMRKLMTNEEKRISDSEAAIESKDTRTTALIKEKEEKIIRSRERAQASKQLRDDLRAHYSTNDIDQLSRQVMLQRRIMTRVPDSSRSCSIASSLTSLDQRDT